MVDTLNRPEHSPEDLPYRTELSGMLRDGVEAVREEAGCPEGLARVLENARDIGQRKPKRRSSWTRRLLIASGVAAAVLVLAMVPMERRLPSVGSGRCRRWQEGRGCTAWQSSRTEPKTE